MPGAGRSRCRSCTNKERLDKEVSLQRFTLESQQVQDIYIQFANWMHRRDPASPLLIKKLIAQNGFFEHLDSLSQEVLVSRDGNLLMSKIGVGKFRKHLVVQIFFREELGWVFDDYVKEALAEKARVERKLMAIKSSPYGGLLEQYVKWLVDHKLPIRTVRLYLRAAEKLCGFQAENIVTPLTDERIQLFLERHSGSRASLARFIGYCKSVLGWSVSMPAEKSLVSPPKTLSRLQTLLSRVYAEGSDRVELDVLTRIISTLFGLRRAELEIHKWSIESLDNKIYLKSDRESFLVPEKARALVDAWIMRTQH